MDNLTKYTKTAALILLFSLLTTFLSKYIFEQFLYKHRDINIEFKVRATQDFKLVVSINKLPGQFGADISQFDLTAKETQICAIPVPKETSINRLMMMTRPENAAFVIEEIRVGGFYKDIVWKANELEGVLKSHSIGLEETQNYSIEEDGLHVFLSNNSPVLVIQESWTKSFYAALGKDSLIFSGLVGLLAFISLVLFRRKLLGWSDNIDAYSLVFTSVFLVYLLIPFFSAKEIESSENRTLAPFPELNQLIWKIPGQYTKYFNDHFPFRNQLANINNILRLKIFKASPLPDHLRLGKENWLYLYVEQVRYAYRGDTLFSDEQLVKIKRILEEKAAYLKNRNSDFYFIVPPLKHAVYPEYLPSILKKMRPMNKRDQVMAYLKKNSDVKVIDPLEMYLAKKDSVRLYYKTDSHWNQLGAFYAYQMIMNRIAEDHENMTPLSIDDYVISRSKSYTGDLLALINLHDIYFREPYHLKPKKSSQTRIIVKYKNIGKEINYVAYENKNDTLPRLLMFRDSFTDYLRNHMCNHFSHAGFSWTYTLEPERIKQDKPDIVVYQLMERFINELLIENPEEIRAEVGRDQP